ncbi:MAG: hypothetical protein IJ646_03070, partial [Clostridia bacterium]|nr:hypothetical protein [Clostridia bacterium]
MFDQNKSEGFEPELHSPHSTLPTFPPQGRGPWNDPTGRVPAAEKEKGREAPFPHSQHQSKVQKSPTLEL